MSWVQWQGETWPVTEDEADLRLSLWPPDCGYPRQSWRLELFHIFRPPDAAAAEDYSRDRCLDFAVSELFFYESDWRRLSRREICATPAWHEAHAHFTQHHTREEAQARVGCRQERRTPDEPRKAGEWENWYGHDFIVRFGERDGLCFPCEIDAWMIHEDDYYLTEPEEPATMAPFASTPPNLRIITRALFVSGEIYVPRAGHRDPVGAARQLLSEAISYDGKLREPKINWDIRRDLQSNDYIPMPGWGSTVYFETGAAIYPKEAGE